MTSNSKALQDQDQEQDSSAAKHAIMRTLGEDSISSHVAKQETRQGVKEDKGHMIQAIVKQAGHCEIPNSMVHETTEKIDNMKWMIKAQMKIKRIVDNIEQYLKDYTMIILKVDETIDGYLWEDTRKALRLLSCMAGALIITTTRSTHQAKEYCCRQWEPIDCSLVGLYHATVLKLTSQKMQQDNCNPQLSRDILDNCDPHEFCMKMFARALYSKPTRSYEELYNLCTTLQAVSPKSLSSIAQKMIKFSYNDLPKEYKSCLLYLAIFPQGHRVRRSTLIGRWVVEGLITTEDWSWPSSVDKAERCFEMLINRWLIYPVDIGVTGGIKSCMVGDLVYEFITTIAKKQRTVQIRLSHHLARHFSISNDLRLCGSDTVSSFLKKLSESSQFSLLKVLDLETCKCFGGKIKHYLKDICCKILLLKYLSLRRTDVTHLPKEINNLHELARTPTG
ncbi:hypothetical protein PR202_gb25046 [Eleusine coracana subsp. coracana]|uniref:NB-ARC domain-containing protein n=1 Tax=Eleusine coracana subsp. coracana TaxID=191504 RepID=A0AAV5FMI2_ELECO|nr:hypothetical protein PR202_gb25046 [Eleusine coracana subsp. coracana]